MSETTREAVYTLRIEQGPALANFEQLTKRLAETRAERTRLTKALKESQQVERDLSNAVGLTGKAEQERQAALKLVKADIDRQTKALSEATLQEKFLSAQSRELGNDLAKLTELGLRFRDKMADATLQALKQSGALEQMSVRTEVLQRDIAGVNASLEKNQKTLADLEVAYRKGETSEQQYREETAKLNAENAKLTQSNERLQGELTTVTSRLDKAEGEVRKLNDAFRAGQISQEEYRRGLQAIDDSTKSLGAKFDSFVKGQSAELKNTLSSLALQYVGVGAAIYGVQQVLGSAVNAVVNFDQALANVRALGGEYRANIDALGEAARNLGPQFGVGASEALKAVEALAKAGVSAADILAGGLEGALALSAAGTLDVGAAAEIAASALTQFKLQGEDLTRVADLLASGSLNAQGSVEDLGAALNQSGLVAANFGIPVEEAVGALSAFASAGLIGSDAGTSFKTMLQSLVPRSQDAADTMAELGLNFFDAQGNFIGLEGVAGQLQTALRGLSEEQQQAALKTIFGSDAVRAATVLYEQGAEGIQRWTDTVSQTGTAVDIGKQNLDSLSGSINGAKLAWERFILSLENGKGVIATAIRGALDTFTGFLDAFSESNIETSTNKFAERVQANIARSFGRIQLSLDEGQLEKAFQREVLKLNAVIKEDSEFIRNRIQDYADEARSIAQLGGRITNDQKLRLSIIQEAQNQLITVLNSRNEAEKKVQRQTLQGDEASKKQVESLSTLRLELQRLQEQRETIAITDAEKLKANALETAAIKDRIAAIEGQTQATQQLTEAQREQLALRAEMNAQANEPITPINGASPQQVANNADLGGSPLSGQPTSYTPEQLDAMQSNLDAMLAMYDSERQAYEDLQSAKLAAVGQFANALGSLAKEGSAAAKVMLAVQKAAAVADVITKTQAGIVAATTAAAPSAQNPPFLAPGVPNPSFVAQQAISAANITRLKVQAATSIATILAQAIQGFATGGEVSGDIRPSWGPAIRRDNGDNVLITARVGEKVLNERQQQRLERLTGPDVWGAIGVPGYALGGSITRGTALVNARAPQDQLLIAQMMRAGLSGFMAGADILATDLATPRPSPGTVVQNELLDAFRMYAERPSFVGVQEINSVQARVRVIDSAGTA